MDKETINTYNKMAKDYDLETEDFWKRFPHTFLDKFIELSGQKIIDIGSGPGRDGLLLQGAGKDVVCLDASEAMIKISSDKGLRSILGDFNDLPFEDQSFDAVWSYTALLHVPKKSVDIPSIRPSAKTPKGLITREISFKGISTDFLGT
jgi:ubiquinone/menaquinone biosynthesis C-methylase UbiE